MVGARWWGAVAAAGLLAPAAALGGEVPTLPRPPYLGLACPQANTLRCDRVGLAVWLAAPARRVVALIGAREVALDDPEWSGPRRDGARRMVAGFLSGVDLRRPPFSARPDGPGDRYVGREAPIVRVRLRVLAADGGRYRLTARVRLSPGWG